MKGVHRKRILKHLKVDLYIYSDSHTKKNIKIWKNRGIIKESKSSVSKIEDTKIAHKICRKNRFSGRKNETFLLKNRSKEKITHNSYVFRETTIVLSFVQKFS